MSDEPNRVAAEIAREANAHILELEARFHEIDVHAQGLDEESILFFCECGCIGLVASTRTDYSRDGGAWLEGHKPTRGRIAR